ncbi:MAG TPA: ABC transporter ATP-binding protein [Dehalococcoidia bacterium]|jgi:putative ABC transport system ATP-binding protein
MLQLIDVVKAYEMGEHVVHALNGVSLEVEDGEFVAITGTSGSGKSTMMNIIGCLDTPTSGSYLLDGTDVSDLSDDELAYVRNSAIGFVFQNYNLLPRMTALRQVELPLVYRGMRNRTEAALEALEAVGLADRALHKPTELSGGQQQRVAIARALITDPAIVLADEPTGNLDSRTSLEIIGIFQKLNRERGMTVVYVTHEPEIAGHAGRIIQMRDGLILTDVRNEAPLDAAHELARLGSAQAFARAGSSAQTQPESAGPLGEPTWA